MEEVVRAFNYLISSGQALYWGTSEWSSEEIQDAYRVAERLSESGSGVWSLSVADCSLLARHTDRPRWTVDGTTGILYAQT
jgi:aryl-alcohol dehydrogenase-like predicted oxidoreductase